MPVFFYSLEFPDLKIVSENKMMISEYFGISCPNTESQNGECRVDCPDNDAQERNVQIFSTDNSCIAIGVADKDSPLSSGSADVPTVTNAANSQVVSEPSGTTESPTEKNKTSEVADGDTSSPDAAEKPYVLPLIKINLEPEQPVIQQEIVDMYMKSMQQFTESLAKMKLPMDIENNNGGGEAGNDNDPASDKKPQASEKTSTPRVFYGSRAFF
ncbi:uncharacterized protein LOC110105296 [Dendrobium catenatum]|uniref:uncharacterized protein LOC110105296 n=1 Tax=Dendrobium catenatum TaxID=906689 RepID=UPI0009F27FEB|nr:uncharacterized protein LOC110105296 [Dendrobium catenatum]